jgi:hypothetical protein
MSLLAASSGVPGRVDIYPAGGRAIGRSARALAIHVRELRFRITRASRRSWRDRALDVSHLCIR